MNQNSVIQSWRNPEVREQLGDLVPASPAGIMEVSDDFLDALSGGDGNQGKVVSEEKSSSWKVSAKISVGSKGPSVEVGGEIGGGSKTKCEGKCPSDSSGAGGNGGSGGNSGTGGSGGNPDGGAPDVPQQL
jgi:mersacidin/lichenicidin family type 2 lantibiotic